MKDEDRKKIKEFILDRSNNKNYSDSALNYLAKVVACYINCVGYRLALIATHAKRATVQEKDLHLFYAVTTADCNSRRTMNIYHTGKPLPNSVIRHYTHNSIRRYSQTMFDIFSLIIDEFTTQLIARIKVKNVDVHVIKKVLRKYHLYNFLTKPICKDSDATLI
jgi:histone H3/H4